MPIDNDAGLVISTTTAVTVISVIWRLASKLARTDVKVDTLWDFHIRHSIMRGITNETLQVNSPIRVTDKGMEWFHGLEPDLKAWYNSDGRDKLSDRDLFIALEQDFGKRIVAEIATPHNIHSGEATAIAVAICRSFRIP